MHSDASLPRSVQQDRRAVVARQIDRMMKNDVKELIKKGANLKPITVDGPGGFTLLLEMRNPPDIMDEKFPEGWVNFYRVDDYSAVSYFYLDKPVSSLPSLPPVEIRIKNVK